MRRNPTNVLNELFDYIDKLFKQKSRRNMSADDLESIHDEIQKTLKLINKELILSENNM